MTTMLSTFFWNKKVKEVKILTIATFAAALLAAPSGIYRFVPSLQGLKPKM